MKKIILSTLMFLLGVVSAMGQITFVEGSITNLEGEKIDCVIKNVEWQHSPKFIIYKIEGEEEKSISVDSLSAFEIEGVAKYLCADLPIDMSSDVLSAYSTERAPKFQTRRLALEYIYEGEAILFCYSENDRTRYYYQVGADEIKPLVCKKYKNSYDEILENNDYKQELWMNMQCSTIVISDMESLYYKEKPLKKIFKKYNACKGGVEQEVVKQKKRFVRERYNFTIRPRLDRNTFGLKNFLVSGEIDFPDYWGGSIGLENEFYLPFLNNKLSFITEPTFQYYKGDKTVLRVGAFEETRMEVEYLSANVPMGIRYYSYLGNEHKSRLYVDASYILALAIGGGFDTGIHATPKEVVNTSTYGYGIGYSYDERMDVQIRYLVSRGIFSYAPSKFETVSLIFGYRIIKVKK